MNKTVLSSLNIAPTKNAGRGRKKEGVTVITSKRVVFVERTKNGRIKRRTLRIGEDGKVKVNKRSTPYIIPEGIPSPRVM